MNQKSVFCEITSLFEIDMILIWFASPAPSHSSRVDVVGSEVGTRAQRSLHSRTLTKDGSERPDLERLTTVTLSSVYTLNKYLEKTRPPSSIPVNSDIIKFKRSHLEAMGKKEPKKE